MNGGLVMEIKALTESEKITMKCVWDLGDGTRLAHILALANEKYGKDWKSQTVSTFLGKLVLKGYLDQFRDGRYFCYRILISKREYRCHELAREMKFWDDGDISLFASELLDEETFTPKEREKLRAAM
jgi:predicted transcriptional regulator